MTFQAYCGIDASISNAGRPGNEAFKSKQGMALLNNIMSFLIPGKFTWAMLISSPHYTPVGEQGICDSVTR